MNNPARPCRLPLGSLPQESGEGGLEDGRPWGAWLVKVEVELVMVVVLQIGIGIGIGISISKWVGSSYCCAALNAGERITRRGGRRRRR